MSFILAVVEDPHMLSRICSRRVPVSRVSQFRVGEVTKIGAAQVHETFAN